MNKIKSVINKIVIKDEVNFHLLFLVKLSSGIISSEIDKIRLGNVVFHIKAI